MGRDGDKELLRDLKRAKRSAAALAIAGAAVVLLLVFSFFYGRKLGKSEGSGPVKEEVQITEDVLHQQLEGIGELNTVRYYYTNMGRYENTLQFKGQTVPFTKKAFIISYDGVIKAGVDLTEIGFELKDKTIVIRLPEARILSHDVDTDSVQVFDEKNSIFNGLSTEDVTNFQREQKMLMEERAEANGILTEARENTKQSLKTIYGVLLTGGEYGEGYTLEFKE